LFICENFSADVQYGVLKDKYKIKSREKEERKKERWISAGRKREKITEDRKQEYELKHMDF
jgi:hypothetical protein